MAKKSELVVVRIQSELKTSLRDVARKEGRSLSQICELFLLLGVRGYKERGSKQIEDALALTKKYLKEA
jgi:hypothetical protein